MASTQIDLIEKVWTQITTTDKAGGVRHHSGNTTIVYTEAPTMPAALNPDTPVMEETIKNELWSYIDVGASNFIWAYAISENATVTVTGVIESDLGSPVDGGIPSNVTRKLRVEGNNPSVGGGNVWNDIWEGDSLVIPEPNQAGQQLQIVSDSANDTFTGTGVKKIRLDYLDSSGQLLFEEIETNGGTVTTVATNITDVIDFHSVLVGSGGVADGNIDVTDIGNSPLVFNRISSGGNKSMSTLRHLLPDSIFYITDLVLSGDTKGTEVILRSDSSDNGNVYPGVYLFSVPVTMTDAPSVIRFNPALQIPGGARVKVSARAGASGNAISVFINGWVKV